jgi:resuscitation-promoting factor RpfA
LTSTITKRITKRIVGAAAGLALAVGLSLGATAPADAAKNVWDKVAQCESGGNWKINTGNGYYGGLQFAGSTWRAYGGKKYASHAHKASKSQQIAVARKVLADVGPGAWPTCSKRAGLTRANGKAGSSASTSGSSSSAEKWTKKERKFAHKNARTKKPAHRSFIPGKTIRVKKGDDLIKIGRRHDVRGGWKGVYRLNEKKFNWQVKHGKRLFVGQIVRIKA